MKAIVCRPSSIAVNRTPQYLPFSDTRYLETSKGDLGDREFRGRSRFSCLDANEVCSDDGPFHDGGDIRGPVVAGAERLQKWARRSASRRKARVASLKPR
jgi:hypothetical protein